MILLAATAIAATCLGLAVLGARLAGTYRRTHPYKVICRSYATGMILVRQRARPRRHRWVRPTTFASLNTPE
jgi:hypothetical protein